MCRAKPSWAHRGSGPARSTMAAFEASSDAIERPDEPRSKGHRACNRRSPLRPLISAKIPATPTPWQPPSQANRLLARRRPRPPISWAPAAKWWLPRDICRSEQAKQATGQEIDLVYIFYSHNPPPFRQGPMNWYRGYIVSSRCGSARSWGSLYPLVRPGYASNPDHWRTRIVLPMYPFGVSNERPAFASSHGAGQRVRGGDSRVASCS
jgi:hypothetical protein